MTIEYKIDLIDNVYGYGDTALKKDKVIYILLMICLVTFMQMI